MNHCEPPYAAIHRLMEYVFKAEGKEYSERVMRTGLPQPGHIVESAEEVQTWLDALDMTPWAQEMVEYLEGRGPPPSSR